MHVLQVDPSLFTAPYDAALAGGLAACGVTTDWAVRGLRPAEEDPLGPRRLERFFYPLSDGGRYRKAARNRLLKGAEHAAGLARLVRHARARAYRLVHFQWAPLPTLDRLAMRAIARTRPIVLTVHDVEPFNGRPVNRLQKLGYAGMLHDADRLIVHTQTGREALIAQGVAPERIAIVPHGMLPLADVPPAPRAHPGRWRIVLFGRLQPYKGADLLVEAIGRLTVDARSRIEVVIAGEAQMPIEPIRQRIAALGLADIVTLADGRLSDHDMAALLRGADAFVFPYRTIDASGVVHLVAGLDRWVIASDLGAFRSLYGDRPGAGALVPPGDVDRLAAAIASSIGLRPNQAPETGIADWTEIGRMTRAVYRDAIDAFAVRRGSR